MTPAGTARGIENRGAVRRGPDASLRLAVEDPQRVALPPPPAVVAQLPVPLREVFRQPRIVRGAAPGVSEGIALQRTPAESRFPQEPLQDRQPRAVAIRPIGSEQLPAHLVELP